MRLPRQANEELAPRVGQAHTGRTRRGGWRRGVTESASLGATALALVGRPAGRVRRRLRLIVPLLGPAFVACIAYVDPGNFATNFQGGAEHGYLLLWVILAANLMAMLVQDLSAKLGIATGRSLPELCRDRLPRGVTWGLWLQAEVIVMATDLAEFVGAAIALNLLFGVPLLVGAAITAVASFAVLGLEARGRRRFERAMMFFLGVITLGFLYDTLGINFDAADVAHGLVPALDGSSSVLLAAGILGATVMPHVIYLHSALTNDRGSGGDAARRRMVRVNRVDVLAAMGLAGIVNMLMLIIAASLFHGDGIHVQTLQGAHAELGHLAGHRAALAFALALLASGLASTSVGTYAGQVVMQGFLNRRIPLVLRRLLTMAPSLAILAAGLDPTDALVISQVVLSFGIPFALIPLVALTSNTDVMGALANRRATTALACVIAALIVGLNGVLLVQTLLG
jgi:manganese transport protein